MDDIELIVNNPLVQNINPLKMFLGGTFYHGDATGLSGQFYRPLMMLLFSVTHGLFGAKPFFFHLLPLFFHLFNAIIVLILYRSFFPNIAAFFLALIFLIHPVNSETVANIAHLNEILFVTFGLVSIFIAFNIMKFEKHVGGLLLTGLLLLSLFSKETGILFCIIIFVSYFIFKLKSRQLLISPIVATALYLVTRVFFAKVSIFHEGVTPIMRASFEDRLFAVPKIIFFYLKTAFYPLQLITSQHLMVKQVDFVNFFLPLLLIFLVVCTLVFIWIKIKKSGEQSRQIFLFYVLWFAAGLALHAQILPLEYTVADRWLYFPLVGFLGIIGLSFETFGRDLKNSYRVIFLVIICLIIAAFSVRTIYRNFNWKNNLVLATHDIKSNQDSFELELLYGTEQLHLKNYQEAYTHIQKSVDLNPYWLNINNLATVHLALGDKEKALELFRKSAYECRYFKSFENIASINLLDGNLNDSKKALDDGLKLYPNDYKLWYILSLYYEKLGNTAEAAKAKQKYLQLKQ